MSRRNRNKSHTRALLLALVAMPAVAAVLAALQARIDADTRFMTQDKEELLLRSGWLLKKPQPGIPAAACGRLLDPRGAILRA